MPDNVIRLDALVYSVAEVAELLNLALGGTYALVRSGDIPARKLGGRWVIPKQVFHDWLEDVTVEPDPEPGPLLPGQDGLF
ncbi:helix-turn-helix domain-containing protein [Jiangella rhizosphaerae]|uniref:DNA-binding protein n=1 Tax=Jiangella rhizosphaerae TaxID=2293569 RepID=A0A418KQ63_9ACTN|nr:helix-turn-helix domain-containing protein [Jiangella rhizosphaerae]RIQ21859.1 DNA-binding protein [Jiangella rhizosphaerae]